MEEEMRLHVEHLADRHVKAGLSQEEAFFAAQRQFGGSDQFKEECRDGRGLRFLDEIIRDLRYSARSLCGEKVFTTTALLTLAICLGANVAIFTVVHSILLAPLPFADPEQLVVPDDSYVNQGLNHVGASTRNYFEWRDGVPAFAETGAYSYGTDTIGEPGSPEVVKDARVTPSFFRVLKAHAEFGRLFLEDEGSYGGRNHWNVVVLSDAFWRQHFSADPGVLGKTMRVGGIDRFIVGVLPPEFRFLNVDVPLWVTQTWTAGQIANPQRHWMSINVVARLHPGSTIAQAQEQIDALNARLVKDDPEAAEVKTAGFRTTVRGLHAANVDRVRPALLLLQGGGLLLLIVGAVNVMNLLLVRASARAREISVRQALGASRRNIVIYFLVETALLSTVGTLLGLGVAMSAVRFIAWLGVDQLPLGTSVHLGLPIVVASAFTSILLSFLLAVPLVVLSFGSRFAPVLDIKAHTVGPNRSIRRLRHTLISAQISLAFVLLTGAGLLGLSFRRILAVDPGFKPENVLTAWIGLPWSDYKEDTKRAEFATRWLERIRGLPGVNSVGLGTMAPVVGEKAFFNMTIEGYQPEKGKPPEIHYSTDVCGDYFAALGIPLIEGRLLDESDFLGSKRVCVIDEDFARQYWSGKSPLNYRISLYGDKINDDSFRVVGVVGNTKQDGLTDRTQWGVIYATMRAKTLPFRIMTVVRSTLPPSVLVPEMRKALLGLDPLLPLDDVEMMEKRIERSLTFQRSLMVLAALFATLALLLAAIGVYGVMSYSVLQRRREIGVRMALGARQSQIIATFLSLGVRLLMTGLIAGAIASYFVGRLMQSLLFNVSPSTPNIYVGSSLALTLAIFLASLIPSRRAAAASVVDSLREE
jgi:predicted permease